jgi:hypothetical protein
LFAHRSSSCRRVNALRTLKQEGSRATGEKAGAPARNHASLQPMTRKIFPGA